MAFVVILLLSIDLMGSTPVYKSSLHEDRLLKVVLDGEKCKGAGFCEQVCPRNCFQVDRKRRKATMPRADRCVQCGACIVQCLFDALYFKSLEDKIIPPQINAPNLQNSHSSGKDYSKTCRYKICSVLVHWRFTPEQRKTSGGA